MRRSHRLAVLVVMVAVAGAAAFAGRALQAAPRALRGGASQPLAAKLGTNLNWCNDWDPEKLPADLAWSARPWAAGYGNGSAGGDPWAPIDERGWPVIDSRWPRLPTGTQFGAVFEGGPWPGTYKLSFKNRRGTTGDAVSSYSGNVKLENRRHDRATNVTSYDLVVPAGEPTQFIWLLWAGSTGGVTDVHLMRPLQDGTGWHAIGTPLADHIVDRLKWFTTIRTMQTQGGGGKSTGLDKVWSDRTSPWGPQTRSRGTPGHDGGVAIENLVAMANQVRKDLWINIPFLADDDYVVQMARAIKCGTDGDLPWVEAGTSTCRTGAPAFAPLHGDLKLYVEHGNEIWNPGGGYWEGENENLTVSLWAPGRAYGFAYTPGEPIPPFVRAGPGPSAPVYRLLSANGKAEAGASGTSGKVAPSGTGSAIADGPLTWAYFGTRQGLPGWIGDSLVDHRADNVPTLGWRRVGYLAVRGSLLFRQVFGDAAMMVRVRPVLATQHGRYGTTAEPLQYIEAIWGPGSTAATVAGYPNPRRPVSYYLYGLATAPYLPSENATLDPASPASMLAGAWSELPRTKAGAVVPAMAYNFEQASTRGLQLLAYEGGDNLIPELMPGGATAAAIANATLASYHPVQGARMGAALEPDGTPAADQASYLYGTLFRSWQAAGGGLFMHFTLGEASSATSMFGLCAPTSMVPGADLSKGTSSSDCRHESGPKWDAIKAFSRQWNR